jgi:hypothetical protein
MEGQSVTFHYSEGRVVYYKNSEHEILKNQISNANVKDQEWYLRWFNKAKSQKQKAIVYLNNENDNNKDLWNILNCIEQFPFHTTLWKKLFWMDYNTCSIYQKTHEPNEKW